MLAQPVERLGFCMHKRGNNNRKSTNRVCDMNYRSKHQLLLLLRNLICSLCCSLNSILTPSTPFPVPIERLFHPDSVAGKQECRYAHGHGLPRGV